MRRLRESRGDLRERTPTRDATRPASLHQSAGGSSSYATLVHAGSGPSLRLRGCASRTRMPRSAGAGTVCAVRCPRGLCQCGTVVPSAPIGIPRRWGSYRRRDRHDSRTPLRAADAQVLAPGGAGSGSTNAATLRCSVSPLTPHGCDAVMPRCGATMAGHRWRQLIARVSAATCVPLTRVASVMQWLPDSLGCTTASVAGRGGPHRCAGQLGAALAASETCARPPRQNLGGCPLDPNRGVERPRRGTWGRCCTCSLVGAAVDVRRTRTTPLGYSRSRSDRARPASPHRGTWWCMRVAPHRSMRRPHEVWTRIHPRT